MQEKRDSGLEGCMKGGNHDCSYTRKEGFRIGGIQEMKDSVLQGYRKEGYSGLVRYRKGGIQDCRDSGLE